jgi:hypothetical protein
MRFNQFKNFITSKMPMFRNVSVDVVLIAFLYALIKWSLFASNISISFMYPLTLWKQIEILLVVGLFLAIVCWLIQLIFILVDLPLAFIFKSKNDYFLEIPKAFFAANLALVVIDNFTSTIFTFSLETASSVGRAVYLVLFLAAIVGLDYMFVKDQQEARKEKNDHARQILVLSLLGAALISGGISYFTSPEKNEENQMVTKTTTEAKLPNVIIFGTDGVNADHMSVYGYSKETTPFISELAKTSLLSENNFTNSARSLGSDISLLTGKLPLATRVFFTPDILRGNNIAEHLPGIMDNLGYKTIQMGFPYYIDSGVTNMEDSFDEINYQTETQLSYKINNFFSFRLTDEVYFLSSIADKLKGRFDQMLFIDNLVNPYASIMDEEDFSQSDQQKLASLYSQLAEAKNENKPLFVHIHFMVTHGGNFDTQNHVFSKGLTQDSPWMDGFYDDAILDYDGYVKDLVAYLKKNGEYDNTILVLYTDHGQKWVTENRLPLIIHFPNDEYAGVIDQNTQNLDIAPTLLAYLGIEKPDWMTGDSLLSPIADNRLIISGYSNTVAQLDDKVSLDARRIGPPFYQLSTLNAIQCQNIYEINLEDLTMTQSNVKGYKTPCAGSELDTPEEMRSKLGELLQSYGYTLPVNW